jgi:hypothetical protein
MVGRHGERRVRREHRRDERIALPRFHVVAHVLDRRVPGLVVGRGEIDERLAEDAAQAGGFRLAGDVGLEVVHVAERGGSAADHLDGGQPRPPLHKLPIHVLRFGREDEVREPVHQLAVVGDAAEERHRDVRVGVHEAGHYGHAVRTDRRLGFVFRVDFGGGADRDDGAVVDGNGAVLDVGAGHGENGAARDQDVDGRGASGDRGEGDRESEGETLQASPPG